MKPKIYVKTKKESKKTEISIKRDISFPNIISQAKSNFITYKINTN